MLLQGWRVSALILAVLVCLLTPSLARAAVAHPELAKALAYFERGDFQRASADLRVLVDAPALSVEERARAREALAISYYVLGRLLESRQQFTNLLDQENAYQPDPLYVAPEIVAFVADIRRSRAPAPVSAAAAPAVKPKRDDLFVVSPSQASAMELRANDFSAVDLLPFGMAQFRKDHTARGVVLASMQGLFLGANVGLYYYRRCSLKPCEAKYYDVDQVQQAQQLQTMQMVAGSLFIGSVLLGVADGITLTPVGVPQLSVRPLGSGVGLAWETD